VSVGHPGWVLLFLPEGADEQALRFEAVENS
jgi:hypothetical protein